MGIMYIIIIMQGGGLHVKGIRSKLPVKWMEAREQSTPVLGGVLVCGHSCPPPLWSYSGIRPLTCSRKTGNDERRMRAVINSRAYRDYVISANHHLEKVFFFWLVVGRNDVIAICAWSHYSAHAPARHFRFFWLHIREPRIYVNYEMLMAYLV